MRPPQDNRLVRVQIINAAFPSLPPFLPDLPFLPSFIRDTHSRGSHVLPRVSRSDDFENELQNFRDIREHWEDFEKFFND